MACSASARASVLHHLLGDSHLSLKLRGVAGALRHLAPGIHHDLGVSLGIGAIGERALHLFETDMAGDPRTAVDRALGDVVKAVYGLIDRVAGDGLRVSGLSTP